MTGRGTEGVHFLNDRFTFINTKNVEPQLTRGLTGTQTQMSPAKQGNGMF